MLSEGGGVGDEEVKKWRGAEGGGERDTCVLSEGGGVGDEEIDAVGLEPHDE